VLVWQASSREMNPNLRQSVVDRAMEEDAASAEAEYMAQFRRDIESFIDSVLVKSLAVPGRIELPPIKGVPYRGFTDPAGGSGADSYTIAISHLERSGAIVLDLIREVRPPFSPEGVTKEFAETFKGYGIRAIRGDRYAGSWPAEQFAKNGIMYFASEKTKSEMYKESLPLFNSRRAELLDNKRLLAQLSGLERRTTRGTGNDSIDHGPGQHDDLINSACGSFMLTVEALKARRRNRQRAW
jgi:hypothetical protein